MVWPAVKTVASKSSKAVVGLEDADVGQGYLDGGQFGQQVSRQVVRATDEHTEVAHGALLG